MNELSQPAAMTASERPVDAAPFFIRGKVVSGAVGVCSFMACLGAFPWPVAWRLIVPTGTPS